MTGNFEYMITRPGIFKITNIVLGAICVGLAIYGHYETEWHYYHLNGQLLPEFGINPEFYRYERELLLVWVSAICLTVSLVLIIIPSLSDPVATNKISKMIDATFHFAGGIALVVAGSFMIYNAVEIDNLTCRNFEYGPGGLGGGGFGGGFGRFKRTLGGLFGGGGFGHHFGHDADIIDSCRDMYNFGQKLAAGVLAIVNGILYVLTGVFVITSQI